MKMNGKNYILIIINKIKIIKINKISNKINFKSIRNQQQIYSKKLSRLLKIKFLLKKLKSKKYKFNIEENLIINQ